MPKKHFAIKIVTLSIIIIIIALQSQLLASEFIATDKNGNKIFRVLPAYSMMKIPREQSLNDKTIWRQWNTNRIMLSAAKDETESFQLVIIPGYNGLQHITIKTVSLKETNSNFNIPIECNFIEYVRTIKPKNTKPVYVGWWPDILMPIKPFDVPAGRQQPIWFRINVPPNAKTGIYKGKIEITADNVSLEIPITLKVRNFKLPRPGTLACPFGLYPGTLKRWYGISDKENPAVCPIDVFVKWCEFLGKYRLTPKNIGREYWSKSSDGKTVKINLDRLKKTVGKLSPKYYPPYSFAIYRLPNPSRVLEGKEKKDIDRWISEIKAGLAEYKRLNFPKDVFLYGMDEASEKCYPLVKETYTKIKHAIPNLPIMQTLNHAPPEKLVGLVDIWCPLSPRLEEKYNFYKRRQQAGDIVWMYVCCVPCETYANFFIDEPAIDHRILFWQLWQKNVTGLLYWSTTWWIGLNGAASGKPHFPDTPIYMKNTIVAQKLKNNGDGLLIWPGPNETPYPSIRLEIIRDGIEDYEYLAILKSLVKRIKETGKNISQKEKIKKIISSAEKLISVPPTISKRFNDFTHEPEILLNRREKIANTIEQLMQIVNKQNNQNKNQKINS